MSDNVAEMGQANADLLVRLELMDKLELMHREGQRECAELLMKLFQKQHENWAAMAQFMSENNIEINAKEFKKEFKGTYVAVGASTRGSMFVDKADERLYVMCKKEEGSRNLIPVGYCCAGQAYKFIHLTDKLEGTRFEKIGEVISYDDAAKHYHRRLLPWKTVCVLVVGVVIGAVFSSWSAASRRRPGLPFQTSGAGTMRV